MPVIVERNKSKVYQYHPKNSSHSIFSLHCQMEQACDLKMMEKRNEGFGSAPLAFFFSFFFFHFPSVAAAADKAYTDASKEEHKFSVSRCYLVSLRDASLSPGTLYISMRPSDHLTACK